MSDRARFFLTSERLGFRTWSLKDVDLAVALWGDPKVAQFIGAGGPPSRTAIWQRLAAEMATQAEHGVQYWPIFLRKSGTHVGCCGLRPYRHDQGIYELGVHIRPSFWRQGLALEAATAVIDYAFDRLGVRALFAGHNPANTASRQMILKLGFQYTHEELYPPTGLNHPSYLLTRAQAGLRSTTAGR
jgi:RimJ/RimL family protein N-acetyltransferase